MPKNKQADGVAQGDAPQTKLRELLADLRSGALPLLSYVDQLQVHFERREPGVRAFVEEEGRFERLREDAEALQRRYPEPEMRPPLFGAALGVKDIFHVDGMQTRAGSTLPVEALQGHEGAVVTAFKKAGALILGKTVTTEFAYFAPGPTRNPHHPAHTPGGSSSGSAAAVGAGLCPLALGTQTIGSVNRPAAFCGVVGLKPSYERISRAGVIPLSPSLDHVGLFTTDIFSMTLAASLVLGNWQPPARRERAVLAVPQGPYLQRASREGLAHFEATCSALARAGFEVKEVRAFDDFEAIEVRHMALMSAEAARVHDAWFSKYDHLYHAKTAALLTRGAMVSAADVVAAREARLTLRRQLLDLMNAEQFDLWITPAAPGVAPAGLESTGDPVMNLPWTQSGLPSLTIPSGYNEQGLPFGLQVVGPWHGDELLLVQAQEIATVLNGSKRGAEPVKPETRRGGE
ncbi:MAG: amidase [Chloroflexota bacterium]